MPLFSIPSRIDIYHHVDVDDIVIKKLDKILLMLGNIQRKEEQIMANMADLIAQVAANTTVTGSAITLIKGMALKIQELIDTGADPVALQAAVDELKASADALGAAVTENTPQG